MTCKDCKNYNKYYIYSKESGFTCTNKGECSKLLQEGEDGCFSFEKEESDVVKQENFSFENVILEMAIMCEKMTCQLDELVELYKEKGRINIPGSMKKNNTIIYFK